MPAWWPRKSSKSKEETQQNPHGKFADLSANKTDVNNYSSDSNKRKGFKGDKPRSFDEGSRNSPRGSKDFGLETAGSSGFSGFGSDSVERRGHPLPRPSSIQSDHGAVSGSVSSVSSSGSSEDHPVVSYQAAQLVGYRGQGEIKFNIGSRSPGPASRGATSPTSPLNPRLGGTSLESPTRRSEDGRSQGHPLPLPPGSPTSPSALPTTRSGGVTENAPCSLSKWKKGRLLGRGTFGHVYLGFNSENGQMCAIKEVRVVSDDQTSKECLKQLNQEINLLNQLSHPNIVRYHGSELGEEALSVYLEYVSGGSIHKLLEEYGAFKEPVIQNYTRQIVSGLAYLHGRNTVHRDIKGANILVDPNGEIKLADFGMAKHITSCSSMLSFKGSPYWMAPEVVMNTNGYSLAVDIWSLGCTILEMATSKPPWSQYEGVAAIFKIGNSKDMPDIPDYLSNDAKSFVKLCLQRDPSARPTAAQLLDHSFIRDQATTGVANISITREAFPHNFDGSRTPPILELHSQRPSITSDVEYASRPMVTTRLMNNPRDNVRTITSLPVSPCSSPLRQYGPAHKSCFLSPPHPTFPLVGGQSSYNINDYSAYPVRPNSRYAHDPWFDNSLLKAQTPGASPRARHIL
ncbi:mitogen-activated protein kinase kinase kinase YODA [Tripterygium wilfordii]|uniref:mitogen-activated protein kinase kinase kinase n=1 Tax=Tripterygium wilfordii TaxID=458696 RepID=A0A7J7DFU0_TRIWF|nr:mitogen-activated protein kinase kinase kinase 3-like [Tripterygium wilfordii]KAF5745134.1 mitogen-activated protein kinase kinase kinase YODA [Tripterygium wilfordii]